MLIYSVLPHCNAITPPYWQPFGQMPYHYHPPHGTPMGQCPRNAPYPIVMVCGLCILNDATVHNLPKPYKDLTAALNQFSHTCNSTQNYAHLRCKRRRTQPHLTQETLTKSSKKAAPSDKRAN